MVAMLTATSLLVPFAAGCGGGGNDNGTGGGTTRSAAINAVQGARQVRSLLGVGLSLSFGETRQRQSGRATTAARSATRIATWARQNTLKALQKGAATRQTGDVFFDEQFQLYYRFVETDTSVRLNYFRDANATQSAGFISLATRGNPERFPLTLVLSYNLTAGEEPGSGELNIRISDENGETTRVTGTVRDTVTGVRTEFNLTLEDFGNRTTGDIRVADSDGTVEFRNLVFGEDGSFTADLVYGNATGHLTEDADGGGTLTLNDPAGPIICEWNAAGAGTIRLPDGTVQTISDFDNEA
jgi:hypothetical protein